MLPKVSFYSSAILRQTWRASCKLSHRCLRLPSGKVLWNRGFLWWTWKHQWHPRAIRRLGNKAETMSPGQHPWGSVLLSQTLVTAAVMRLRQLRWKPKARPIEILSCFPAFSVLNDNLTMLFDFHFLLKLSPVNLINEECLRFLKWATTVLQRSQVSLGWTGVNHHQTWNAGL